MTPSKIHIGIVLIFARTMICTIDPSVINYTISTIEYLADHQTGRFDCIFVDISDEPSVDNGFEEVLMSPRLDHVVKYVLNDSFEVTVHSGLPRNPGLLVVNIHAEDYNFELDQFVINPNTRILILFEKEHPDTVFFFVMHFFRTTQFTQIVLLESSAMVFIRVGFDGFFVDYSIHLEPNELFRNILLDMEGRTIRYGARLPPTHSERQWMNATGQYVNATTEYVPNANCRNLPEELSLECYAELLLSMQVIISLDGKSLSELNPETYRILFDVMPEKNVIAVPMPRSLNVVEMFSWPYSLPVWIVLALIIVTLELVNVLMPGLFKNDPILLVVCGFEQYNLHRAGVREQWTFIAMIIFFFLMTNAYETRIISYMIEKPSIGRLATIQELIDSGMQMKADKVTKFGIFNQSRFNGMLVDTSNDTSLIFDRECAYYGNQLLLMERVIMPMNYDHDKKRPAYYILSEADSMVNYSFWLPMLHPLLEVFYFTRRALFEAGLLGKWHQDFFIGVLAILRAVYQTSVVEILDIADMFPAWVALSVGFCLSSGVFVGEVVLRMAANRLQAREERWAV